MMGMNNNNYSLNGNGNGNSNGVLITKKAPKSPIRYNINLTQEQKDAKASILTTPFNFVLGQAGSGKSLLACSIGLDLFFKRQIEKIVITRPTVSSEDNGFLPGSLEEKFEPWLVPIFSNLYKIYNKKEKILKMRENQQIELVSLSHFRGRTFDNSLCIVDEFQNLTKPQLQMVISRLGVNSLMILTGDENQIDLKHRNDSAIYLVDRLECSQYVNKIILTENYRHPALNEVLGLLQNRY